MLVTVGLRGVSKGAVWSIAILIRRTLQQALDSIGVVGEETMKNP